MKLSSFCRTGGSRRAARRLLAMWAVCFWALTACACARARQAESGARTESFAALVAELSEPGGYFDTDNLISNEKSYLQVMGELARRGISGGVYLGVGPDQNFSYIAQVRPAVAIIVDIRRDNLLLHLLFKAVFANAPLRIEYLCLLTGRAPPPAGELAGWRDANIEKLTAYAAAAPRLAATSADELPAPLRQTIAGFGVPLSAADYATIARFYQTFAGKGLGLQFQTFGRPIQFYNPTYRDLLTERDLQGRQRSYLAREEDYQFLRRLQGEGRVIPVVGDVAGSKAMPAIAAWMKMRGQRLSTLYISNVEDYLFRGDLFGRYVDNVKALPRAPDSVVIRSVFGRGVRRSSIPGYYSTSSVQSLQEFLARQDAGAYSNYYDLIGE